MLIFGDESGWTGPDLLDAAQPVLVTATLRLDKAVAATLVDRFFKGIPVEEVKFAELVSLQEGRDAILEFLKWMSLNDRRQRSFVTHKRFALVAKMVDMVIENAAYAERRDLYSGGRHIELQNSLHHELAGAAGASFSDDLLKRFQDAARKPSNASIGHFVSLVRSPPNTGSEAVLAPLRRACDSLGEERLLKSFKTADLDVLGAGLWAVAFAWNQAVPQETLDVVYDEQSKLKTESRAWAVLRDPAFHPEHAKRAPIVDNFQFGTSVSHQGIQLADVLAGCLRFAWTARATNAPPKDVIASFQKSVEELVAKLTVWGRIWPDGTHQAHNGLIDYEHAQALVRETATLMESRRQKKTRSSSG